MDYIILHTCTYSITVVIKILCNTAFEMQNKVFHLHSCERGPVPPPLSHSWHVLSCRYLALTTVEIFVLFLESAESSSDKQKISKSTQYICRVTQQRLGRGRRRRRAGSYLELKVSVDLDCQGMPGGASISLLPFINTSKRGENAAAALCKFCIFQWCIEMCGGCLWIYIAANNKLCNKMRKPIHSSNKVIVSMTTITVC